MAAIHTLYMPPIFSPPMVHSMQSFVPLTEILQLALRSYSVSPVGLLAASQNVFLMSLHH